MYRVVMFDFSVEGGLWRVKPHRTSTAISVRLRVMAQMTVSLATGFFLSQSWLRQWQSCANLDNVVRQVAGSSPSGIQPDL